MLSLSYYLCLYWRLILLLPLALPPIVACLLAVLSSLVFLFGLVSWLGWLLHVFCTVNYFVDLSWENPSLVAVNI